MIIVDSTANICYYRLLKIIYIANMNETSTLKKNLLHYLDEMLAIDLVCIEVREQTSITDEMIICSARSSRHVKSIASTVLEKMKHDGYPVYSKTGIEHGEWALLDFGEIILHVMQADTRTFYNLEGLWQQKN